MNTYKLGKDAPKIDGRTLRMTKYLPAALKPAPRFASWTPGPDRTYQTPWPMFGNDELGDCVPVASGHQITAWTVNAGAPAMPTRKQIIEAYSAIGGYVPGDPSTDNGCAMLDALNYWRKTGIAGHQIGAYVALDPRRVIKTQRAVEIMTAVEYFGGAYIGLALPVAMQGKDSWYLPGIGTVGDGAPGSWGGHCVPVLEYSHVGVKVITWGAELWASWSFLYEYCDEAYGILSPDWIAGKGLSPSGFDYATLYEDLAAVTA